MSIRRIKLLKVLVWPHGLTHHEMANELHRIAKLVEDGFIAGEVISEANDGGWWLTEEEDPAKDDGL